MSFSIVIPVYNELRVSKAIESVLNQNFQGKIELIIIDGGSDNCTMKVIKEYEKYIDILISEPDKGIFDALNKGINLSSGKIVGLLGADDKYNNNEVLSRIQETLSDPAADGCYGDLVYVYENDNVARYWKTGKYYRMNLHFGWTIPHFTLFLKRYVYDNYPLLDINYTVAADYEYILRLLYEYDIKLAYINKILVRMTLGGNSNQSIRKIIRGNLDAFFSWKRYSLTKGVLVPFLKPIRKLIQYAKEYKE